MDTVKCYSLPACLLRDGLPKKKLKFLMAFAMKGGGISRAINAFLIFFFCLKTI